MYRDDDEALFQRADALQREVDELREELAKERAKYVPAAIADPRPPRPPPIPPTPFAKRKPPATAVPVSEYVLNRLNDELDHLGEVRLVDHVVGRVRALDTRELELVARFLDELVRAR